MGVVGEEEVEGEAEVGAGEEAGTEMVSVTEVATNRTEPITEAVAVVSVATEGAGEIPRRRATIKTDHQVVVEQGVKKAKIQLDFKKKRLLL